MDKVTPILLISFPIILVLFYLRIYVCLQTTKGVTCTSKLYKTKPIENTHVTGGMVCWSDKQWNTLSGGKTGSKDSRRKLLVGENFTQLTKIWSFFPD